MQGVIAATKEKCDAELRSAALNPIREKAPPDLPSVIPMEALVLNSKPTPIEKKALLAWSTVRARCNGYGHGAINELPLPPSMDNGLKDQLRQGINNYLDNVLQSLNYLTAMLYNGQITYGEFNRQRGELRTKLNGALTAWISVIDAQDKAQTAQKAAVAQKQLDTAVAVLAAAACAGTKGQAAAMLCQ